jgi:signal transduction histidine kinase
LPKPTAVLKITIFAILFSLLAISCTSKKEDAKRVGFDSREYKSISTPLKIKYLDSVASTLKTVENDSIHRDFLFQLAAEYYYLNHLKKSMLISDKVLQLAEDAKDTISMARANFYKADCFDYTYRDSAYYYYHRAELFYSAEGAQEKVGQTLFKKGYVLFFEGNYLESEIQVSNALKLLKNSANNELLYSCYVLMGYNFEKLEEYDHALDYFNLSKLQLDKLKQSNVDFEKTNNYTVNHSINISNVYDKMREYDKSVKELESVKSKELRAKWPRDYASVIGNLGYSKLKLGDINEAKPLFEESLLISKQHDQHNNILYQLVNLGEYYATVKDTTQSIIYLKDANALAEKLKAGDEIKLTLELLGKIDFRNNSRYNERYIKVSDSLVKLQRNNRNKYARIEYETSVIEDENKLLSSERIYILIVSLFSIFCLLAYIIYRYFKNQKRELNYREQKQLAEEEIYNLLKKNQIELNDAKEFEQNRISRELHDGVMNKIFGVRLQLAMLNESDSSETKEKRMSLIDLLQQIEKEIRNISHDLNSDEVSHFEYSGLLLQLINQQNGLGGTLFMMDCDPSINWDTVTGLIKINIYRIIQEAFLNVLKYADAKLCVVNISYDQDMVLRLSIEDDGKGFDLANRGVGGIGFKNMNDRAKLIKAKLVIESELGKGTKIILTNIGAA